MDTILFMYVCIWMPKYDQAGMSVFLTCNIKFVCVVDILDQDVLLHLLQLTTTLLNFICGHIFILIGSNNGQIWLPRGTSDVEQC